MSKLRLNLVVIRSANLEKSVKFYQMLGLKFIRHRHGHGIEHFASQVGQITFEIYHQKNQQQYIEKVRIGFQVTNVKLLVQDLQNQDALIIVNPTESEWGLRAVVADPDGHRIELTQI